MATLYISDHSVPEAHTRQNPASSPLILVTDQAVGVRDGKLADIAPTMLELLGVPKPAGMTGESVVV